MEKTGRELHRSLTLPARTELSRGPRPRGGVEYSGRPGPEKGPFPAAGAPPEAGRRGACQALPRRDAVLARRLAHSSRPVAEQAPTGTAWHGVGTCQLPAPAGTLAR